MQSQTDSRGHNPNGCGGQPGLTHHTAFNLCAAKAACVDGMTLLLASTAFHAQELARRIPGKVLIHPISSWPRNEQEISMIRGSEIDWSNTFFQPDQYRVSEPTAPVVVWAIPERTTWFSQLDLVNRIKDQLELFIILGETNRSSHLRSRGASDFPARLVEPMSSIMTLSNQLQRTGWHISETVGFQGPSSLFWGALSRLPALLGRDDLVDRCVAAARRSLIVDGRMARWSTVWLIVARSQSQDKRK